MKSIFLFFIRSFIAVCSMSVLWFALFLGFDQAFIQSSLYAVAGGIIVYYITKWLQKRNWLKQNGLTASEYKYVQENLKEARQKIARLQRTLFRARSLGTIQQLVEAIRLSKRIYHVVEKEPKRFYQGESFFFYHLDSCVGLAEKYTFLSAQPIRDQNVKSSLEETKQMLNQICESLEKDLITVLSNDIEHLQFELNVAKKQTTKWKDR
ncbi:5-bromo-4-chloroindolyl phosphate hydrolysis family protein [Aeribacillus pallidus]|nr:5-bromo-4-chloroindolyl phosphate hydrolysis family protein [Aeribacillus pallidus]